MSDSEQVARELERLKTELLAFVLDEVVRRAGDDSKIRASVDGVLAERESLASINAPAGFSDSDVDALAQRVGAQLGLHVPHGPESGADTREQMVSADDPPVDDGEHAAGLPITVDAREPGPGRAGFLKDRSFWIGVACGLLLFSLLAAGWYAVGRFGADPQADNAIVAIVAAAMPNDSSGNVAGNAVEAAAATAANSAGAPAR